MNAKNVFELLRVLLDARKKPTTKIATLAVIAWVATVAMIGKWALIILFPVSLIAMYRLC